MLYHWSEIFQGVIAAETGHISVHEAGAIEANRHKVLAIPHQYGKISAGNGEKYDDDHTVIRFAADWGTTEAETNALIDIL